MEEEGGETKGDRLVKFYSLLKLLHQEPEILGWITLSPDDRELLVWGMEVVHESGIEAAFNAAWSNCHALVMWNLDRSDERPPFENCQEAFADYKAAKLIRGE